MDSGSPSARPKKLRFSPKPLRRAPQPVATEIVEGAENEDDDHEFKVALQREFQERLNRQSARLEKKSSSKVTFVPEGGTGSSTSIRTSGLETKDSHDVATANLRELPCEDSKALLASVSTDEIQQLEQSSESSIDDEEEAYEEPWDKVNSYYPTTLPWKYPDMQDKEKFKEGAGSEEKSAAWKLGLMEEDVNKTRLIFFQFPPTLPFVDKQICVKESEAGGILKATEKPVKGKERAGSFTGSSSTSTSKGRRLEEMPEGFMGKMLIYKSGSVKLKLGDVLFNVSPGMEISSDQIFMAVNTTQKNCTSLGRLDSRAVVGLDEDSI